MSISLRKLAMDMDACPPNISISCDRLARLHRWGDTSFQSGVLYRPEKTSLKKLAAKHDKSLRFLWLNTYLVPQMQIETPIYDGVVFDGAPARPERAYAIGQMIKNAQYDVAALCEVFSLQHQDMILSAWDKTPYWVRGPGEGEITYELEILGGLISADILTVETASSGLLTLLPGRYGLVSHEREIFTEKGERTRDADAWANKGILKVVVDTGFNTKLEIYSTHLIFGGGLRSISDNERYSIQRKQLDQLVNFINRSKDPKSFIMVAGDFNIYADENFYHELQGRLQDQLGLEDVWPRYATAKYGAKVGKTNNPSACKSDSLPCDRYADDNLNAINVTQEGRIDYIFIQKPLESHDITIDISRPRRLILKRNSHDPKYNEISYLSDHVGLELTMFLAKK